MRLICVVLILASYTINTVKAGETPAFPTDVPPIVGSAIAIPDNDSDYYSVRLTVPKIRWFVVGERRPKLEWPTLKVTAESTTLELLIFNDRSESASLSQLSENSQSRIVNLNGKRLSSKEVLKRLKSSKAVLISVSGKMPNAYHLQTTKPDTMIAILGISADMPRPNLLPQPLKD
ncbi:MAG: hypothetical protein CMM03_13460 [Rhodopirellula sp.]|nr:hypothetical protein [Rhodopirellula sp.]|tara:strand:+ start:733 stop:1260 length:528 start_codon:yes stop_codon:yes gene_type:complete